MYAIFFTSRPLQLDLRTAKVAHDPCDNMPDGIAGAIALVGTGSGASREHAERNNARV